MCGIVGALARNNVVDVLLNGLQKLEYRGYDSAGVAIINNAGGLSRERSVGRVAQLKSLVENTSIEGNIGIAHTRWATHGVPSEHNAHPHLSNQRIALVHNGIIENYQELAQELRAKGYVFTSETDTEVLAHKIDAEMQSGADFVSAVRNTVNQLEGAWGLGVICADEPDTLVVARKSSPLLIGIGEGEYYVASDMSALVSVVQNYKVLEDGDVAILRPDGLTITNADGQEIQRKTLVSTLSDADVTLDGYEHYMLKEIHEQGRVIADTLEGRIVGDHVLEQSFGITASEVFDNTRKVKLIACGTSYHAAMVARYWFENFGIGCDVEIASEYINRSHVVDTGTLFVTISQSGETLDTMSALELAKTLGYSNTLSICNVPESSLVRASDLAMMTHAGPEIGVASTKAFTTQLAVLLMLGLCLRRRTQPDADEASIVRELRELPAHIERALELEPEIAEIAKRFSDKQHALFLGRGDQFPIALEGALKLKEISYIHAEAYAAGELKHGPLALVDKNMPVVAVAPNNNLIEKLKGNIQEVSARGGQLVIFADPASGILDDDNITTLKVAPVDNCIAPIIYTIPLQLLAYHVALLKGTDIDKPRNLAKSVTVQ
jgi:glutamine---fructose-6-phosphate transaminase (isomerizing)